MRLQLQPVTTKVPGPVTLTLPAAIELSFGSAPAVPVTLGLPAALSLNVDLGGSLGTAVESTLNLPTAITLSLGLQPLTTIAGTPVTLALPAALDLGISLAALTPLVTETTPLTLAGIDCRIEQGGHVMRLEPLVASARSYGGHWLGGVTANRGHARVWGIQTGRLDRSDALTLRAAIAGTGRVTAQGTSVGGGAVTVYAREVEMQERGQALLYASLTFELHEADP